jgi:hypothetical protein
MIPRPAVEHYARMQRQQSRAALAVRRAWRSVDPRYISESLTAALPVLSAAVAQRQLEAATLGAEYGAATIAAQGFYEPPTAWVDPSGFAGVSSRGAPLESALYSAAPHVKGLIAGGMSTDAAMNRGRVFLESAAMTQVADAGRGAASVDTFTRPKVAYVRMLNPPSCSRCAVLAGRIYRNNEGFLRHPKCDCIHVPTSVKAAEREGLVSDPYEYFQSLSATEQDRLFTKAGAEAIRDGSDLFQVVNSRRGMSYAGLSADGTRRGQRVRGSFTDEGTTKRGYFAGRAGGDFHKVAGSKYTRSTVKRLTPDAIYAQNLPRERTLELLKSNGYLLKQGQVPEGAIRGLGSVIPKSDLTAAEQRLQTARLQFEAAQRGDNPFGKGPVTPQALATAEKNYRRWLLSGGQIHTR